MVTDTTKLEPPASKPSTPSSRRSTPSAVIPIKYAQQTPSPTSSHKYAIYDILHRHPPCPHLLTSLLRVPNATFLVYMAGGSLDARFRNHQVRESPFGTVLRVTETESTALLAIWLFQLVGAVVWLEGLSYVHGDLRPANMLLSVRDHLRLADFDYAETMGVPYSGNGVPW
ncbi:hypothetical protein CONLIGDRAFT_649870 [Coniochaeta ligniaria NRRL 30616]|uniref:EKC/KEOPS complex subunit BUD32 n=1 Tax=Coniochaeta ligniaria NRRL 30616 TaxID=1408157 RepID=A0A1J7J772_9PEZI|nr:hypothetical protein CONLIGDRAFT_649870 [Coniochaeta ligniaria NRRL 30616]